MASSTVGRWSVESLLIQNQRHHSLDWQCDHDQTDRMFGLITILTQADLTLYRAVICSGALPPLISTTVCISLITTLTGATASIANTNSIDTASRTSVRSLDAHVPATGRCAGANTMRRLCAAHKQMHLAQSCNMGARINLGTLRDIFDSSERSGVLWSRSTKQGRAIASTTIWRKCVNVHFLRAQQPSRAHQRETVSCDREFISYTLNVSASHYVYSFVHMRIVCVVLTTVAQNLTLASTATSRISPKSARPTLHAEVTSYRWISNDRCDDDLIIKITHTCPGTATLTITTIARAPGNGIPEI